MTTHTKLFQSNPDLLQEMFALRRSGWTIRKLGIKYHCDHSTILHHCQKYGVTINTEILIARRRRYKDFRGVFEGMKYATYLEEEFINPSNGRVC